MLKTHLKKKKKPCIPKSPCQDINLMPHDVPRLEARTCQQPQGNIHDESCYAHTYKKKKKRKLILSTCYHDLLKHET
jgi:hypothetical protein